MHVSLTVKGTPAPEGRVEADQPGEKFTGARTTPLNHIFHVSLPEKSREKESVFVGKSTGVTDSEA